MEWRFQAIRGATTVSENTEGAIQEALTELLDEMEVKNQLEATQIVSATFSVTRDLNATFPAAIARRRSYWDHVPMLDVQHMHVEGSLERCIRVLIHVNIPATQIYIWHPYLRQAKSLRSDWSSPQRIVPPGSFGSRY